MIGYYCFALFNVEFDKLTAAPGVPPKSRAWIFSSPVSPLAFESPFFFPVTRFDALVISNGIPDCSNDATEGGHVAC